MNFIAWVNFLLTKYCKNAGTKFEQFLQLVDI